MIFWKSKTIIRDSKQTNKQTKGQWLPGTKGEREIRRVGHRGLLEQWNSGCLIL